MIAEKSIQRDNLGNFRKGAKLPVRRGCLPLPELRVDRTYLGHGRNFAS